MGNRTREKYEIIKEEPKACPLKKYLKTRATVKVRPQVTCQPNLDGIFFIQTELKKTRRP